MKFNCKDIDNYIYNNIITISYIIEPIQRHTNTITVLGTHFIYTNSFRAKMDEIIIKGLLKDII